MIIRWLGHSCVYLEESTGTKLVADPFDPELIGYGFPKLYPDAVTVSAATAENGCLSHIKGEPVILNKECSYDIRGVRVTGLAHKNTIIYKYAIDGLIVCHPGSCREDINAEITEQLIPVNILLLPVGGGSALTDKQAREYIDVLLPELVIPIHYHTKNLSPDIESEKLDRFLRHFDDHSVVISSSDELKIDRGLIKGGVTKIMVLPRYTGGSV